MAMTIEQSMIHARIAEVRAALATINDLAPVHPMAVSAIEDATVLLIESAPAMLDEIDRLHRRTGELAESVDAHRLIIAQDTREVAAELDADPKESPVIAARRVKAERDAWRAVALSERERVGAALRVAASVHVAMGGSTTEGRLMEHWGDMIRALPAPEPPK